jgi:hypothetical protein
MTKYVRISSYIRKPFLIYDFATASIWISFIYEEKFFFFFISVVLNLHKTAASKAGQS